MLVLALHPALAAEPTEHNYFASWGFAKLTVAAEGWAPDATAPLAEPVGPALAACLPNADLVARVDATFTLTPDGHTRDVSVSTGPTAEAATAGKCVRDVLAGPGRVWPAVTRPTRVTFALSPAASIGALVGRKGTQLQGGTLGAKDEGISAAPPDTRERPPPVDLAPGVHIDPWSAIILGNLDKGRIDAVVYASGPAFGACREEARGRVTGGAVTVKFVIDLQGKVSSAVLKSSTVNDGALETCTVAVANTWVFPAPVGGGIVIASYRLDFGATP